MRSICRWMAAWLLLLPAAPAAIAQSQDLGHKILGGVGLDAGTQPEAGLYVGDRLVYYRAHELNDRNGEPIPVKGLDIKAGSNVTGVSRTFKLDGALYLSASVAVPIARLSLNADEPRASIDRFGFGDLYVEPARLGLRHPHFDVVTSYGFYAPTGQAQRSGVGARQWSHQVSAGGTVFFDKHRGWRLSALASYDLYRKKTGIDIRRGDSAQVQGGFGGPMFRRLEAGVAGYALWQVQNDSGSDLPLVLRGARDHVIGLGPEIDIVIPAIRARLTIRHEWDLATKSRPEGQILVAGLSFVVWRPRSGDSPSAQSNSRTSFN
jgi:hypothetical protein